MNPKPYRVLLLGNPNCGKTSIFNSIASMRAKVGNYSGVTVDKKSANVKIDGLDVIIDDLPGVYSLSHSSIEERIVSDIVGDSDFDLIVNIIDSNNLERSLFLTTQLADMSTNMLLVLNMSDELEKKGKFIDAEALSKSLNVNVVKCVAFDEAHIKNLKSAIAKSLREPKAPKFLWDDLPENLICKKLSDVKNLLLSNLPKEYECWINWLAIRILENDTTIKEKIKAQSENLFEVLESSMDEKSEDYCENLDQLVAAMRYSIIDKICAKSLKDKASDIKISLDSIFLNKFLGIPLFFAMMFCLFQFVFIVGDPMIGFLEDIFAQLADFINNSWDGESILKSVIVEGAIGGVGAVVVFLPNIVLLFLALSILEDSGYMARVALLCDRILRYFGIGGASTIPMLLGFGCTVPAIVSARTIKSYAERMVTILVLPLFSCGARLPIYTLLIPIFFAKEHRGLAMFGIYVVGIIFALIYAKILRLLFFKGKFSFFAIELPPYRFPVIKNVLIQLWERTYGFLKKAGTIILAFSIVLWVLTSYPVNTQAKEEFDAEIDRVTASYEEGDLKDETLRQLNSDRNTALFDYTISGRVGTALEPVFAPLGFDNRIVSALICAMFAKEVFISQLGIIYGMDEDDEKSLSEKIARDYTPIQGFSILLFILLSLPCIATIATTYAETKSYKIALAQMFGLTISAYIVCLIFYQTAMFLYS